MSTDLASDMMGLHGEGCRQHGSGQLFNTKERLTLQVR